MTKVEIITGNTLVPVIELTELLAAIDPKRSPAFSANLHRWMRTHGRAGDTVYQLNAGSKLARVYGVGAFFIGQPYNDYEDDSDFSGALLMQVLCMGRKVVRACYAGDAPTLIEVADFWNRYQLVGRCTIDANHSVLFVDNDHRFHQVDGKRTCKWCSTPVANC